MEKLLTVVIPTYNMENYLRRCLDSLIVSDENMQRLEVLVVNDGSKDSSSQIAHEYESKYPQTFRVIDKENGNYGSCVNRGLKEATGKYFRILDADDYFNKDALELFVTCLCERSVDVDMIITNMSRVDGKHKTESKIIDVEYGKVYNFPETDIGRKIGGHLFMHQTTYNLQTLRVSGLRHDEGVSYTDIEYVYIPLEYVKKVVFLNFNLYQYILGREGQTMEIAEQIAHINDFYVVKNKLLPLYLNNIQNRASNLINAQREIIINIIFPIFKLSLTEIGREKSRDKELHDIANQLKQWDVLLWKEIKKNMGKLPVLLLWERFGIYATSYKSCWNAYQYLRYLKQNFLNR